MNGIEDMEKMRARVDRFKPRKDGSEKDPIYDLAVKEEEMREKIKNNLRQDGIDQTVGSRLVNELANDQSTHALETMEAKEQARTDELTKLHNRAAYNEDIPKSLALAYKREGKECALLFFDLDSFKKVNDTHGHGSGDTVLKEMAILINNTLIRESDIAYRWGGEEFVAYLPNTDIHGARKVAERIRQEVEKYVFKVTNNEGEAVELKVTVSIGCSSTEDHEINREMKSEKIFQELERESYSALHDAKHSGKNRVIAYGEEQQKTKNS